MAPMIDVVFQLLIYFILTFREELPEAHLAVNLPSPAAAASATDIRLLELQVEPGQVLLMGTPRSLETIREKLEHLGRLDPEQTVLVKVNPLARTEELVRVLDMCKVANLTKLNVVTLR